MRTAIQITFGVLLGGFILLFCMANDDWVVIHLPLAPWDAEPSFPIFEARVFALMLACLAVGLCLCFFLSFFLRVKRRNRDLEKEQKFAALEKELEKANRFIAATTKKSGGDAPLGGGDI
jgi:hypothetical protein